MVAPRGRRFASCQDDKPPKRRRGDTGPDSDLRTESRTLACPYYKSFPTQFTRCLFRNHLTSTSFVLQHLIRCHMRPIQCPRCNQPFDKANKRDWHLKQQTCRRETSPIQERLGDGQEGIDAYQLALLHGRPRRGLTEAERWYAIWDVLFPDAPRPDSPYITSPEDEILQIARQAMKKLAWPRGASCQLLDRLDWSTISSTLENPSADESADQAPSETASLSPVGSPTNPQPGDAAPSSTTFISSVSSRAGSSGAQSSSNSVPALPMGTPKNPIVSLDRNAMISGHTKQESQFAPVPFFGCGAQHEAQSAVLSDGLQMQWQEVGQKGGILDGGISYFSFPTGSEVNECWMPMEHPVLDSGDVGGATYLPFWELE